MGATRRATDRVDPKLGSKASSLYGHHRGRCLLTSDSVWNLSIYEAKSGSCVPFIVYKVSSSQLLPPKFPVPFKFPVPLTGTRFSSSSVSRTKLRPVPAPALRDSRFHNSRLPVELFDADSNLAVLLPVFTLFARSPVLSCTSPVPRLPWPRVFSSPVPQFALPCGAQKVAQPGRHI